eukprot:GHVU01110363.1.p2 GENE.GHVU01110363.1~~GHVU01110363.1.p2  ORF type:complete len:128 (-),score=23.33 GHVU01110363.1:253-636(-)
MVDGSGAGRTTTTTTGAKQRDNERQQSGAPRQRRLEAGWLAALLQRMEAGWLLCCSRLSLARSLGGPHQRTPASHPIPACIHPSIHPSMAMHPQMRGCGACVGAAASASSSSSSSAAAEGLEAPHPL